MTSSSSSPATRAARCDAAVFISLSRPAPRGAACQFTADGLPSALSRPERTALPARPRPPQASAKSELQSLQIAVDLLKEDQEMLQARSKLLLLLLLEGDFEPFLWVGRSGTTHPD